MRWCSRSAAGDMSSSTDFAGPDSDTCGASEGGVAGARRQHESGRGECHGGDGRTQKPQA